MAKICIDDTSVTNDVTFQFSNEISQYLFQEASKALKRLESVKDLIYSISLWPDWQSPGSSTVGIMIELREHQPALDHPNKESNCKFAVIVRTDWPGFLEQRIVEATQDLIKRTIHVCEKYCTDLKKGLDELWDDEIASRNNLRCPICGFIREGNMRGELICKRCQAGADELKEEHVCSQCGMPLAKEASGERCHSCVVSDHFAGANSQ